MEENRQPHEYPQFHEKDDTIGVGDNYELITKFSMEPNLGHYRNAPSYEDKLAHINKNLLFTNLKTQHNEPEKIINQLKNITILKRFVITRTVMVPTGQHREVVDPVTGDVYYKELYAQQVIQEYRFKNTIDNSSTLVYGVTSTAAGRDGKLLETLKSTFLHKEQSIEDKTETKKGTWLSPKNKR
jgi:hypothetical protein